MLTSLFALWCQFQQTFRSINHFIWTAQSCFSCFLLPTKCLIKNSQEKFLLSIFLSLENSVLHMSCYIMTNYNIEWMLSWLPFAGQKYASICCFEKPVCFSRQTIWLKQKSALIAWCSSAVSRHWFWSNKLNFCACSNKNSINKPKPPTERQLWKASRFCESRFAEFCRNLRLDGFSSIHTI